jgi:hypothetical protein
MTKVFDMSLTKVWIWQPKGEPGSYLDIILSKNISELSLLDRDIHDQGSKLTKIINLKDSEENNFHLKIERDSQHKILYTLSKAFAVTPFFAIEKSTLQTVNLFVDFQIDSKYIINILQQQIPRIEKLDFKYENESWKFTISIGILSFTISFKLSFKKNLLEMQNFKLTKISSIDSCFENYINNELLKDIKKQLEEIIFSGLKKIPEFSAESFKYYLNVLAVDFPLNIIQMRGSNIIISSHVIGVLGSHPTTLKNFKLTTGKYKHNPDSNISLDDGSFYFKTKFNFDVKLTGGTKITFDGETTLTGDMKSSLDASIYTNGKVFSEPIKTEIPGAGYKFGSMSVVEKNFILQAMIDLTRKIDVYLDIISEKKNDDYCFGKYILVLQGYLESIDGPTYLQEQKIYEQKDSLRHLISNLITKAEKKEESVEDGKKNLIFCTLLSFSYLMMDLIQWGFPNASDNRYLPEKVKKIFEEIQTPTENHLHSSLLHNSKKYPFIELALIYFGIDTTCNLKFGKKFGIKIFNTGYSVKYHKQLFWDQPTTFYEEPVKEWEFEQITGLSSHVKIFTFNNNFKKYVGVCSGFNFKRCGLIRNQLLMTQQIVLNGDW